jgi:hypothetical protein
MTYSSQYKRLRTMAVVTAGSGDDYFLSLESKKTTAWLALTTSI